MYFKNTFFYGVGLKVTTADSGIKLVKSHLSQTFTVHAMWEVLSPKSDVSNCPFLSSVLLPSTPFCGSQSFVLLFEFSLADRLSQIISFNSPIGT